METRDHNVPIDSSSLKERAVQALEQRVSQMAKKSRTELNGITKAWQPSQFLPDFRDPIDAQERIRAIQEQARSLPPEVLLCLAADTVTEEGLPLFSSALATLEGLPTDGRSALQQWGRKWAAEEHRHGMLLNAILRYSGRIDMEAFERTVQLYLEDGFDTQTANDPYKGFVYTSFQERATQRSHKNVATLAKNNGAPLIKEVCGQIAADELYHGKTYSKFVSVFFEQDPNGMMQAVREMWERGVTMPAHNMREIDPSGKLLQPGDTFVQFSDTAQRIGVYTARDYAEIGLELLEEWKIVRVQDWKKLQWEELPFSGLNEQGEEARQKILRRQKVIQRIMDRPSKELPQWDSSWLVRRVDLPL